MIFQHIRLITIIKSLALRFSSREWFAITSLAYAVGTILMLIAVCFDELGIILLSVFINMAISSILFILASARTIKSSPFYCGEEAKKVDSSPDEFDEEEDKI